MLPALGKLNAERARRLHGVVEEQLEEIAHAVEEQEIRVLAFTSRYCAIIGVTFATAAGSGARSFRFSDGDDNSCSLARDSFPVGEA